MIARDSKSYPYLAIAQHYNVPYWKVLRFSEGWFGGMVPPYTDWKYDVWKLEQDKLVQCNIK
jgi:hypothetical protein